MRNPLGEFFRPGYVTGVEITGRFIGAVQVYTSLKGMEIDRVAWREAEKPEHRREVLKDLFRAGGFRRDTVVTCLPASRVLFRELDLPFGNPRKLDRIIKYQMEPFLPCPVDDVVVDFLPPAGNGAVMSVAAPKTALANLLEEFSGAGLDPFAVGVNDLALFYLYLNTGAAADPGPVCIIRMGEEDTGVQVIREGRLDFIRILAPLDDDPGPLEETLRLYGAKRPASGPPRILLTGHPAADGAAAERIGSRLRAETSLWRPFDDLAAGPEAGGVAPELQAGLGVPLGLAVSLAAPTRKRFDLRREEFGGKGATGVRKTLGFTFAAVIVLVFLFTFQTFQGLRIQEKRYRALNDRIRQVFVRTYPGARPVKGREAAQMREKIQKAAAEYRWIRELTGGGAVLDVLKSLTGVVSRLPGVKIDDLSVEEKDIRLHGTAATFETVDRLKHRLNHTGFFGNVRLLDAKMDKKEKVVRFNFAMERP